MIAKVMEDAIKRKKGEVGGDNERKVGDLCPRCGELALVREGNCVMCERCGFTSC
jgi:predicted RNA-binding Zn-ribbon protein involved in translation (DUF1610 family)